jgi:hypothetical protein
MKRLFLIAVSILSSVLFINGCKSNSTGPADTTNTTPSGASYYPNSDGTSYKYSVVKTDSSQNSVSGSRSVLYSGTSVIGAVTYQNEIDTISFSVFSNTTYSLFIKDNYGVGIILDTTGFYNIIPDAFKPYVIVDKTIRLMQNSFLDGNQWTVFDMSLKEGALSIDLVHVVAVYKGMEQVPLNLSTGAVTQRAEKIQYTITLNITKHATSVYTANAWLANNIGIIKIQGNATLLDAFTGSGINFADTTSTVTQSLISYKIK